MTQKGIHTATTAGSAFVDTDDVNCCDCNQGVSLYCTNPVQKEGAGSGS